MSRFSKFVEEQIKTHLQDLAHSVPGTMIDFNPTSYVATINITKSTGSGIQELQLPWPQQQLGVYAPIPPVGSKVIIGFREGNRNYPYVISTYDPDYENNTLDTRKDTDRATWSDLSFLSPV